MLKPSFPGRALVAAFGLLSTGALLGSAAQTTYQAENAVLSGGATVEAVHGGFVGGGYVNSALLGSTTTFNNLTGSGDASTLTIRYALGVKVPRTGNLTINGATQSITFQPTAGWTTWTDLTLTIPLGNHSNNTLQFASTGSDLANIDQITVADVTTPPPPPPGTTQVPRWQPQDLVFVNNGATPSNPFQIAFSADATGPGGIKLTVPGFYDGGAQWKIRFSPTVEGNWTLTTHSNLSGLDQKQVSLVCIHQNPDSHGAIKVDTQHRHHFVFEDGTRWWPMGYECDWLWASIRPAPRLTPLIPSSIKLLPSDLILSFSTPTPTTPPGGREKPATMTSGRRRSTPGRGPMPNPISPDSIWPIGTTTTG